MQQHRIPIDVWAELNRTAGRRANQPYYGEGLAVNIHEAAVAFGRKRLDVSVAYLIFKSTACAIGTEELDVSITQLIFKN